MLKIYNSLTRIKEEFTPLVPGEVRMYTCGVTVYDHCHLGHGRSLYIFEVIRRYLEYKGFKVHFLRNITDIDDKMIAKARVVAHEKNLSIEQAFKEVQKTYIDSYYEDLKLFNLPPAVEEPRATHNIPQMITFIQKLIEKGFAYEADGNVYFSVRACQGYGKLSGKKIDDLLTGVRIESDPGKRESLDFALWKARKDDEPYWDSPFGQGRPGWHIECSVMSQRFLGETIDIHGGGKDLVFPHHENEAAQSESCSGKPFARYWIHHGLITIEGEKMAKSLGNFFTLKEILAKYDAEVLKLYYLSAHYASSLDFSIERLEEFVKQRARLYVIYDRISGVAAVPVSDARVKAIQDEFEGAMDEDFNFSAAKGALFALSSLVAELGPHDPLLGQIRSIFFTIGSILCLFEKDQKIDEVTRQVILERIAQRKALRAKKEYVQADLVRDQLLAQGIILDDLRDGTTIWRLKRG